jgi:small subunit ribosomal protein S3
LGHKVHPTGFRLGIIKGWDSRWYADKTYKNLLAEDRMLRDSIRKRLANAGISRVEIERVAGTQIAITIHTAKPGIVIGKSGESVERLRQELERQTKKKVRLSIVEIRNPELDAYLVGRSIADQLEKRVSFRRAMKQGVQKTMRAGAKGVKVVMGGRLGGAEIARVEKESEGSVPLQTLRADIDYGLAEAHTTYGVIGIKVWIYHGDVLPERQGERVSMQGTSAPATERAEHPDRRGGGREGRGDRDGRGGPRGERGDRGNRGDRGPRGGGSGGRSGGTRGGAGGGSRAGGPGGPGGGPRPPWAPRPAASGPRPEETTPIANAADDAAAQATPTTPRRQRRAPADVGGEQAEQANQADRSANAATPPETPEANGSES